MSNSSIGSVQQVELDILIEVDKICRKHEITYFLDAGTVLGAIRHGGFIPWDDDIDIGMLREDYERFLTIAEKELPDDLFVQNYYTDKAPSMYTKIRKDGTLFLEFKVRNLPIHHGIFIDIFPYDFLPEDDSLWEHMKSCTDLYNKFQFRVVPDRADPPNGRLSWYFRALFRRLVHYAHLVINPDRLVETMDKEFQKYPESTKVICHSYGGTYYFNIQDLLPCREIEFENYTFCGPNNPDALLRTYYGDYMVLPPEEERYSHRPYKVEIQGKEIYY